MKHQALFSLKDKREKIKCRLLQFLLGALRVNQLISIRLKASWAYKNILEQKDTTVEKKTNIDIIGHTQIHSSRCTQGKEQSVVVLTNISNYI